MADIKVSEFIVNELSEEKLQELKDAGTVPPNEMFLTDEEGEQFTRGLPLGTIVASTVEIDDPYLQKADGRSLAQDGMYAEFCTWLKSRVLANSNNVPTCTIEEYATEMNTYFQCGKYVINDTSETIRSGNYSVPANSIKLPTLIEFVASNNGGQQIGLAQLDEFKSHTHHPKSSTRITEGNNAYVSVLTSTDYDATTVSYTGGEETRPKNIRYPHYIVVATSLNDSAAINAEGVVSEVNNVKNVLSRTEQVDVLYDFESNDININWEHTGGIGTGTTITGKDFSKYKYLLAIVGQTRMRYQNFLILWLDAPTWEDTFGVSNDGWTNLNYTILVNNEKTSITIEGAGSLYKLLGVY